MNKESLRVRFGRRLREIRVEQGISQEKLAEKSGVLRTTISRIETGRYNASIDIVDKITSAMCVTFEMKKSD